jgi:hypothetical protein
MAFRSSAARTWQSPGLTAALKARKLPQRLPTDADRPPVSTFPGRKEKRLLGQLALGEDVPPEVAPDDATRLDWLLTIEPDEDELDESHAWSEG